MSIFRQIIELVRSATLTVDTQKKSIDAGGATLRLPDSIRAIITPNADKIIVGLNPPIRAEKGFWFLKAGTNITSLEFTETGIVAVTGMGRMKIAAIPEDKFIREEAKAAGVVMDAPSPMEQWSINPEGRP